ncbi:hypothetical protein IBT49_23045 [Erwinia sp. S63]|uniref:hypothetical protein n=1 Tax=Erwinia sp. S63 TaxID=2769341 RepID=UPI00190A52B0|nr:hypothetical protein [Erwinia sp. S63]MBK0098877.1 hypothetical protein [Erwinia sp. S63]
MTLPDLLLMAGLAVVNLYLWVNLVCSAINWRRRRAKLRSREYWFRHQPPAHSPLPLLFVTLATGLISVWMLGVLLPVI